jgi:hypothetical protein
MIKQEPPAQIGGPPRREHSPQGGRRTVFISKIPRNGITDDVLYADFRGFGRVLATKVFIPKTSFQGKPNKVVHFGAFIEFATNEAAMDVMNTVKEYRGVETGVKWAHRSLVESIKELQQREAGNEDDERERETMQASTSGNGAVTSAGNRAEPSPGFARYGTLYVTEDVCEQSDDDKHAFQDPVGSFIQEQAQRWHQELRAYYAAGYAPAALPPPASVGPSMGPLMPAPAHMSAPAPPHPLVQIMPPTIHHHHTPGMTMMHTYPAGMPITPVPPPACMYY